VFEATAFPAGSVPNAQKYCILELPGLRRSAVTEDGSQHLLFENSGQTLQIRVRGADLSDPVHLLTEAIVVPSDLKTHLNSLECFNRLYTGLRAAPNSPRQTSKPQRLRLVLRVLDGRLAGASYREIAIVLFGRDRVESDWEAPDDHLKNRVRRAAQRGKFLMKGGYRGLLA